MVVKLLGYKNCAYLKEYLYHASSISTENSMCMFWLLVAYNCLKSAMNRNNENQNIAVGTVI